MDSTHRFHISEKQVSTLKVKKDLRDLSFATPLNPMRLWWGSGIKWPKKYHSHPWISNQSAPDEVQTVRPNYARWLPNRTSHRMPLGTVPDGKVHEAYMGPTWGRKDPGGSHVGPMNISLRGDHKIWVTCMHGHLKNWLSFPRWWIIFSVQMYLPSGSPN